MYEWSIKWSVGNCHPCKTNLKTEPPIMLPNLEVVEDQKSAVYCDDHMETVIICASCNWSNSWAGQKKNAAICPNHADCSMFKYHYPIVFPQRRAVSNRLVDMMKVRKMRVWLAQCGSMIPLVHNIAFGRDDGNAAICQSPPVSVATWSFACGTQAKEPPVYKKARNT